MKLFFSTTVQNFSCVCLFDCNFLNCFSLGRMGDGNVEESLEKKNKGLYRYPHVKIWFPENNSTSIIVSLRINITREKYFFAFTFGWLISTNTQNLNKPEKTRYFHRMVNKTFWSQLFLWRTKKMFIVPQLH